MFFFIRLNGFSISISPPIFFHFNEKKKNQYINNSYAELFFHSMAQAFLNTAIEKILVALKYKFPLRLLKILWRVFAKNLTSYC